MLPYRLTRRAEDDARGIWRSVAPHDQSLANGILLAFHDQLIRLAGNRDLGRERNELAEGLRSHLTGDYVLFYRSMKETIVATRILHRSRDAGGGAKN